MNRPAIALALMLLAGTGLWAQAAQGQAGADDTGLDNLFNGGDTGPAAGGTEGGPSTGAVRPDDILRDDKLHFFGSVDVFGDVGAGWGQFPPIQAPWTGVGGEVGGSLQANLGFEVRPATELRVRGTMSFYFPGPGPLFPEMIVDYSILNSVFFRAGIFSYTWGNSQFFLYGNLPGRGLSTWSNSAIPFWERNNIITNLVTPTVPISLKMSVPFGTNGLTLLARFDMANYGFPDQYTPNPKYAGYGLQWDMVTGPIEWSVAGFYQNLLTPRALLAMKTSLLGFDLSTEATVASPYSSAGFQGVYPTLTAGISREWSDAHIKIAGEYGYNGERNAGLSLLPDNAGPGGHNSALVLRFTNLGDMGLAFTFLWQHNWSDGSGLLAPFIEVSPVALTTLQIGLPLVYGPDNSEVLNNRLVPGGKRFELLVLIKIGASYRQ